MPSGSYVVDINGIELRLLRYFVAVAEELHFGHAAERIGISQPPLSQQIKRLERTLGVELFRRTKRHVQLTEAGAVFLDQVRPVLAQTAQAVGAARRAARGEVGRLAVGMVSSATYEDLIPGALRTFRERFPDAELALYEWSTVQQIELLHRGELQVGFVRPPVVDAALSLETVTREPLLAALPAAHRLASAPAVSVRDMAEEAWVMLRRDLGLGFHDLVMNVCLAAGFRPGVTQEATQIHTLIALVAAGLGVTLVPGSVENLRRRGVVYLPLADDAPPAEIAAAYLKSSTSPVLREFLKILRHLAASKTIYDTNA
jgi:DNA-binding transcriptional LysR family regulator